MAAHGSGLLVGLDGDDTLWHSESHFITTTERLGDLLAGYLDDDASHEDHLIEVERRNLARFGYGVKAFTLSMIETAVEVSGGRVTGSEVQRILDWSKELMDHPVELLDGVVETVGSLAEQHDLVLVTKGDLLHQESKVARSGLTELFDGIHIVSEKDPDTYRRVLEAHGTRPDSFVMVGNSVRSDVQPVLQLGGTGIHVPYHTTWALELVENDDAGGYERVERIADVPGVLERLAGT
ncbi:MAG: HAD hydrolase-like protein [Microthrixaceae bacterium]|nr:HAD hydrolase-like protein [Microthrixaceae bacterium]MCB1012836.1 HAD hydrolase-like protein [Microthrixaceae bacterium]MCB9387075.1 HAD hydrolase-like protein [Microthrixaceae bacterium]MCO5321607.1 HAD hydrolase-like protein [Microthrixaceae bacterium]